MPKIVFVGAGSTVFAKSLLMDILSMPDLSHSQIMLYDIDEERLGTSAVVANSIQKQLGTSELKFRRNPKHCASGLLTGFQLSINCETVRTQCLFYVSLGSPMSG